MKKVDLQLDEASVKKEKNRLKRVFGEIEGKKRNTIEGLIDEAAFMRCALETLKGSIMEHGVVDEMPQGDYSILRESPYVRTYNSMMQRYTTVIDKLIAMLPKEIVVATDGFDDFVNERCE